nr:keratin, type I cytoskeletal 9 [Parasteatoda tepidariorum]
MFNGGAANVLQNTGLSQMLEDNGLGEALNRVSEMVNNDGLAQALDSFGLGGVATSGQLDQLIRPENMQQAISKITDILGLENLQQILSQLTDGLDLGNILAPQGIQDLLQKTDLGTILGPESQLEGGEFADILTSDGLKALLGNVQENFGGGADLADILTSVNGMAGKFGSDSLGSLRGGGEFRKRLSRIGKENGGAGGESGGEDGGAGKEDGEAGGGNGGEERSYGGSAGGNGGEFQHGNFGGSALGESGNLNIGFPRRERRIWTHKTL